MSIEVIVKQKLFGKQSMPLEVILGEELSYGTWESDRLIQGKMGDGEFVAYHPKHLGRGFSVIWTPEETKQIELRLPQPAVSEEYDDFYAAIARMVTYWDGKLLLEGRKTSLSAFLDGKEDMLNFNRRVVRQFAEEVLGDEHDTLTVYSALFPLDIGKAEAAVFLEDPDAFSAWLHERQSSHAVFASAAYYLDEEDNHPYGIFTLYADTAYILPGEKPMVPYGLVDPSTGHALECTDYRVLIGVDGANESIVALTYDEFYGKLPTDHYTPFDGKRVLLAPLSVDEIRCLYIDSEKQNQ